MSPRARNLDDIAPDEPASTTKTAPPSKKSTSQKKKLSSKKAQLKSASNQFRQEVYRIIGVNNGHFTSFMTRPQNRFSFQSQFKDEEVLVVLRRHPVTNLPWIFVTILMIFAPAITSSFPVFELFPLNYRFIGLISWYLLTFAFFLENFLSWYFNVNIITDERILDIDFYSLMYKEISDAELEAIQDVTVKQGGFLHSLFNYGDVYIQTAAEIPEFEFLSIPNPTKVQKILQLMRLEEKQETLEGRIR
jgi:hypothetical protein